MSDMTTTDLDPRIEAGCQYLVKKPRPEPEYTPEMLADPDFEPWYPDFPEDCYLILPCGEPCDPEARHRYSGMPMPFCSYHREPMEMDDLEFEHATEVEGRSWSNE